MGTLIAKATKKAMNDQMASDPLKPAFCSSRMSKVSGPPFLAYH